MGHPGSSDILNRPIDAYPAATVACFDPTCGDLPRRQLDDALNVQFLERLGELGVPGVLIAASTGHGHLRTIDELRTWFESAAQARLPDTTRMALLRPEDGPQANEQLVSLLKQLQYDVVFVRPGTDLTPEATPQTVADNMGPLVQAAAECELAVGVYSISDVSGLPLTADAAALLVKGPGGDHIVAAKVTEKDYQASTLTYLRHPALQNLKIVQGWDPHLARALRDGPEHDPQGRQRCGVTSGPMSLAVHQYLAIFAAAGQGDWEEVEVLQHAVTQLFQSMQDDPDHFADLQRAKFIMGLGHPLTAAVTDAQTQPVLDCLAQLPRTEDRQRLSRSLNLMGSGPFQEQLQGLGASG